MKVRKLSISLQLFLWLAVLLFVGISALGFVSYNHSKEALFRQIQNNVKNIASGAAANVDGEALTNISANPEDSESYASVLNQLALFRDNMELEYIYTLKKQETGEVTFLVDSDTEEPADVGEECESTKAMFLAYEDKVTTADEETVTDEWGVHLSAYAPVFYGDTVAGLVGVDVSAAWISEQIAELRNVILLIAIATYVISLGGLYLLVRKFRRSMIVLNNKVKELASGSGDLTREIDITTGDELEIIAGNMNDFIHQIKKLVQGVAESTESLKQVGENLDTTVRDNTAIMHSMNSEIEDITASMEESSASSQLMGETLSQCVEDIESFSGNISVIAEDIKKANGRAQNALNTAKENRKNAMSEIETLKDKMTKVNEEIRQVEQVQRIAQEVSKIASQTRMLSLNASIEAARAGEQGKGFSVVAMQVGKLSTDINNAVTQINQINEQVLEATGILSEATDDIVRFISEDVVKDYDFFASISEEYGNTTAYIRKEMKTISTESEGISGRIKDINEQMHSITDMVGATSESAMQLAASTGKLASSMEDLNVTAKKNAERSETLNEQVEKYIY